MYTLKEFWQLRDFPRPKGTLDGNVRTNLARAPVEDR